MNSVILQIAAKYIKWLLIIFATVALLRGHNHPGGGFIAGLLISLATVYHSFAFNFKSQRTKRATAPERYIVMGLSIIILSVLPSVLTKAPFMSGIWFSLNVPFLGELKIGTPFLFDIGVFFAVIGVVLLFFFSLNRTEKWK